MAIGTIDPLGSLLLIAVEAYVLVVGGTPDA
jgi:hypothetical protein